jgi:hypothetical protein
MDVVMPVLKFSLGRYLRLRYRFHSESGRDLVRLLAPFGLTEEHVAVVHGGELGGRTRGQEWVDQRVQQEAAEQSRQSEDSSSLQQPPPVAATQH